MALPVLEKTWQFDLNLQNTVSGSGATDIKDIFIKIKNAMKGFALSPWTVVGSSNAVSSNMSGSDLLVVPSDVVCVGSAPLFGSGMSWIVLEQPGLNGGTQVCFSFPYSFSGDYGLNVTFSPAAGFTGGSATARPTATDEVAISGSNSIYWISSGGQPDRQYVAHVMQSTDGSSTRIIGCHDGIVSCYFSFEEVINPTPGWLINVIGTKMSVGNSDVSPVLMEIDYWYNPYLPDSFGGAWWARGNVATPMYLKIGTEWHRNAVPLVADNYANEISGAFPLTPIGLHCISGLGQRGRYGHLVDQWMTVPSPSSGDNMPGDASKQFVVVGDFVFPWDGATTMLLG